MNAKRNNSLAKTSLMGAWSEIIDQYLAGELSVSDSSTSGCQCAEQQRGTDAELKRMLQEIEAEMSERRGLLPQQTAEELERSICSQLKELSAEVAGATLGAEKTRAVAESK